MTELAAIITSNTERIDAHLAHRGLPSPSFEPESPPRALLEDGVIASRQAVLEATDELHALVQGPVELLTRQPVCTIYIFVVHTPTLTDNGDR